MLKQEARLDLCAIIKLLSKCPSSALQETTRAWSTHISYSLRTSAARQCRKSRSPDALISRSKCIDCRCLSLHSQSKVWWGSLDEYAQFYTAASGLWYELDLTTSDRFDTRRSYVSYDAVWARRIIQKYRAKAMVLNVAHSCCTITRGHSLVVSATSSTQYNTEPLAPGHSNFNQLSEKRFRTSNISIFDLAIHPIHMIISEWTLYSSLMCQYVKLHEFVSRHSQVSPTLKLMT
jgi:hypothetical protein